MADVVNLNRFRKRKQREADRREAEQNRVVHGRSKADKRALRDERERAERALAGHQREESRTQEPTAGPPGPATPSSAVAGRTDAGEVANDGGAPDDPVGPDRPVAPGDGETPND
jgi:hypothetical protein